MCSMNNPLKKNARVDRAPRRNVMLSALVETFQGTSSCHRIRDVSTGGARIDNAGGLRPGATVLVTVGTLNAVAATVVWVRSSLAGLRFATQVDVSRATANTSIAVKPSDKDAVMFTPIAGSKGK